MYSEHCHEEMTFWNSRKPLTRVRQKSSLPDTDEIIVSLRRRQVQYLQRRICAASCVMPCCALTSNDPTRKGARDGPSPGEPHRTPENIHTKSGKTDQSTRRYPPLCVHSLTSGNVLIVPMRHLLNSPASREAALDSREAVDRLKRPRAR